MIVAPLNQKGGGKTTLAMHPASRRARQEERVTLIDADLYGSALDWSEQRARHRLDRLFGLIGLARDMLHREAPELAPHADHVVIDGPPRVAPSRPALRAADPVVVLAQPSPFDGWASAEILALITKARAFRPVLVARFVLNRCPARTLMARGTAQSLADHDAPALAARTGRRVVFADVARSGELLSARNGASPATHAIAALACKSRKAHAMTARGHSTGLASRPRGAERWVRSPDPTAAPPASGHTTALTINNFTPALRGRIEIEVFRRGETVADMPRALLAREFPDADGGNS